MVGNLPTELIADILSRLPSKSLLRCRSVCKSWLSLISSSEFVLMHAQNFNKLNPRVLVRRFGWGENKDIYSVHFEDEDFTEDLDTPTEFRLDRNGGKILYFTIVGCCNGVVCLSSIVGADRGDKIILWNPSIRKKLTLIPPTPVPSPWPHSYPAFGFGYDRISDDYKVVRLAYDDRSFAGPQVEVYTVKTGIWKAVGFPHDLSSYSVFSNGSEVFLNGCVHWLAYFTRGVECCSIMTFVMGTELFGEIQLPQELVDESPLSLAVTVLGESLAVIYSNRPGTASFGSSTYMVWTMKEYKNPASWTMVYNMHYPNRDMGRALWLRNNGDIIMASINGNLMTHTCGFVYASIRRFLVVDSVFVDRYQESLALLDAGHE